MTHNEPFLWEMSHGHISCWRAEPGGPSENCTAPSSGHSWFQITADGEINPPADPWLIRIFKESSPRKPRHCKPVESFLGGSHASSCEVTGWQRSLRAWRRQLWKGRCGPGTEEKGQEVGGPGRQGGAGQGERQESCRWRQRLVPSGSPWCGSASFSRDLCPAALRARWPGYLAGKESLPPSAFLPESFLSGACIFYFLHFKIKG